MNTISSVLMIFGGIVAVGAIFYAIVRTNRETERLFYGGLWRRWHFDPLDDITPREVALILSCVTLENGLVYLQNDETAEEWFYRECKVSGLGRHFWRTDHVERGPAYDAVI